jgi:hypothetical protein
MSSFIEDSLLRNGEKKEPASEGGRYNCMRVAPFMRLPWWPVRAT